MMTIISLLVLFFSTSFMWPTNDVDPPFRRVVVCGIISLLAIACFIFFGILESVMFLKYIGLV